VRQDNVRQDNVRQDNVRQDNVRQDNVPSKTKYQSKGDIQFESVSRCTDLDQFCHFAPREWLFGRDQSSRNWRPSPPCPHITGWRRHIGHLKLQVIFRNRAIDYRALLQKRTPKDKASYISSPPCILSLGEDASDASDAFKLGCRSFFEKEPLIVGLFCTRSLTILLFYKRALTSDSVWVVFWDNCIVSRFPWQCDTGIIHGMGGWLRLVGSSKL